MAKENTSGLNVNSRYGPVAVPDACIGVIRTDGGLNQLTVEFSADNINNSDFASVVVLQPGCLPLRGWLEVETAISLSGLGAAISLGTQGGLGTNSADVSGTALGVGFKTAGLKGTWSTGLTATTTVAFGVVGGSINEGAGRFVVEYLKV